MLVRVILHGFLLVYSYKFQPCLGSGLIPNNIRVMSFSSSTYVGIITFIQLVAPFEDAVYCLVPLPLLWIVAWVVNSRRALHYHVPRCSISELLKSDREHVRLVGTMASLHIKTYQISVEEQHEIIKTLQLILNNPDEEPMIRIHAAQTLWHARCHRLTQSDQLLDQSCERIELLCITPDMWIEDHDSTIYKQRISRLKSIHTDTQKIQASSMHQTKKRNRIMSFTQVAPTPVASPTKRRSSVVHSSEAAVDFKAIAKELEKLKGTTATTPEKLQDSQPIKELLVQNQRLVDIMLDILFCATATGSANTEAARLLLDLLRAGYLKLSVTSYLEMLPYLCSYKDDPGLMMDAVVTLRSLLLKRWELLPEHFWSRHYHLSSYISVALLSESAKTVMYCVDCLASILNHLIAVKRKQAIFLPVELVENIFIALKDLERPYSCVLAIEDLVRLLQKLDGKGSSGERKQNSFKNGPPRRPSEALGLFHRLKHWISGDSSHNVRLSRSNSVIGTGTKVVPEKIRNLIRKREKGRRKFHMMALKLVK